MSDNSIIDRRQTSFRAPPHHRQASEIIQTVTREAENQVANAIQSVKRVSQDWQRQMVIEREINAVEWPTASNHLFFVSYEDNFQTQWFQLWARATGGNHATSAEATPFQGVPLARLRVKRLTSIQAAFGFPIQNLAEILAVSRAQIYKWLDISNNVTLHGSNQERITKIERLANKWRALSSAPLSLVAREQLASGETGLQMLSSKLIDEAAIVVAFVELAKRLSGSPKSDSQRMIEAGYTRRSTRRSLPSDE
jgi:hypothetical protein